ncbi:CHAD domain-containing protein [Nodosilinea nodulosa]|uniref:CHAD domain-containing protein n=1 Tax=Nodosilinea nodulosa TaxID=416001 RepID=UPI0002E7298D|nr:CHAD domain-containing protein [Nodosilinea nodulosa]
MKVQPVDPSITLGEFAYLTIRQNFQKIVDQEKLVLDDRDPESLHQMRVGMRRLRTAIQVFDAAIILPKGLTSLVIGKIAKSLGKTRDLDVLQQELTTRYRPLLPKAEKSRFDEVLKQLEQQREKNFRRLKKTLYGNVYQNLKQSVQDWLVQPCYTPMGQLSVLPMLPDLLLPLINELFLHPGWLVGTTVQAGRATQIPLEDLAELNQHLEEFEDSLHALRKQMKGVRYQAEFFSDFYGDAYGERLEEFKLIQDVLGQLQDNVVLRQFLESTLNTDVTQALPTVEHKIRQDRADFWQTWQPLQQRYLDLEFRQSLRSLLTIPQTESLPPSSKRKSSSQAKTKAKGRSSKATID